MHITKFLELLVIIFACFAITSCDMGGGMSDTKYGGLEGRVTDHETDSPVKGVFVSVITSASDSLVSKTDSTGHYYIEEIPVGRHKVKARKNGYDLFSREVDIKAGNNQDSSNNTLNIKLEKSIQIEKVSGDDQSQNAGSKLINNLEVRVVDSEDELIVGREVKWKTKSDKGSLGKITTETNSEGIASNEVSLKWHPENRDKKIRIVASAGNDKTTFEATIHPVPVSDVDIIESNRYIYKPGYVNKVSRVAKDDEGRILYNRKSTWKVENRNIVNVVEEVDSTISLKAASDGVTKVKVAIGQNGDQRKVTAISLNNIEKDPHGNSKIDRLIKRIYKREVSVEIREPAVVFNDNSGDNDLLNYWTSTAYINDKLLRIYLSVKDPFQDWQMTIGTKRFGGRMFILEQTPEFLPKGTQRILTIAVDYGNTDISEEIDSSWKKAQQEIISDHKSYADEFGYDKPAVDFVFVDNILVKSDETCNIDETSCLLEIADNNGYKKSDFEFITVLDLDAQNQSGGKCCIHEPGWSYAVGYIGWFLGETSSGELDDPLGPRTVAEAIADAIYHHEVAHGWGWEHRWVTDDDFDFLNGIGGIITLPSLLGWTDEDGDGTRAIFDSTPYGLKN